MQTVSATTPHEHLSRALATRLARDAEDLPETDRQLRRRFPDEPYRQRFGFIAERLRRTRSVLTGETGARSGHYDTADDLDAERRAWEEEFAAARRRPLAERIRYSFVRTYKPVLDDASQLLDRRSLEDCSQWQIDAECLIHTEQHLCNQQ